MPERPGTPNGDGEATPSAGARGRERALGLALIVLSACSFGTGPFFARPVYAAGLDWVTLMGWRFAVAALLSWAWLLVRPPARRAMRGLSRRRLVVLAGLGAVYVGNSATYFAGLETVPTALAALLVYIYPVLVAVLSIRWARRLEGRRAWFALAVATAGVSLSVGGIDPSTPASPLGILLILASAAIYAVWILLSARLGGERGEREHAADRPDAAVEATDAAPAVAVMLTATAAIYIALATAIDAPLAPNRIPASAWVGLIGIGVVTTAVAVQTFYAGARRLGAAQAALASTVEPVFTITIATLVFGELLTGLQLLGGILVITAVVLVQLAPQSRPRPVADATPAEA
jgi:drug/metabolite transporter (DMT)-like permease